MGIQDVTGESYAVFDPGAGGPIWAKSPKSTSEPILAFLGTNPFATPPRPKYPVKGFFQAFKTRESKNSGKNAL